MNRRNLFPKMMMMVCALSFGNGYIRSQAWKIKPGEHLRYKVAFSSGITGSVKGGEASLSVHANTAKVGEKTVYQTALKGGTTGLIEWFYQVTNHYESFIDTETGAPVMYRQSVRENKYTNTDTVFFDHKNQTAIYKNRKIAVPPSTHDFVSMIYYVRTLDVSELKPGESFTIPFFTSDKVVKSKVVYGGLEQIRIGRKTVSCHAFRPQVGKGKVFNQDYPATIWISAEEHRIPMLIEARMKVGRMRMELTAADGR